MRSTSMVTAILTSMALAGCSHQASNPAPPASTTGATPSRIAGPPPTEASQWDARRQVYVLSGDNDFFRQQTYYRWDEGWYWSVRRVGPWIAVDSGGVPLPLAQTFPAAVQPPVLATGFASEVDRQVARERSPTRDPGS